MSNAISFVNPTSMDITILSPASSSTSLKRCNEEDYTSDSSAGPSRKRSRTINSAPKPSTNASPEERKEARAHRNRIAAQNSRDRRKVYLTELERKVAELEAENKALKAGSSVPTYVDAQSTQKDKENEELRERIRTLEKGWDAVIKALAAQGIAATSPANTVPPPTTTEVQTVPPSTSGPTAQPTLSHNTPEPTIVPSTTQSDIRSTYPISPAPTHSSVDLDMDLSLPSPVSLFALSPPASTHGSSELDVPAAGGFEGLPTLDDPEFTHLNSAFPQVSDGPALDTSALSDAAMEELFREIIRAPASPAERMSTLPLPLLADDKATKACLNAEASGWVYGSEQDILGGCEKAVEDVSSMTPNHKGSVWMGEEEMTMQKILDLLPLPIEDDSLTSHVGAPETTLDELITGLGFDAVSAF